jgi:hypothetical protein
MANRTHVFKDRDVQRLVKAARSAGLDPMDVEVDLKNSRIKVIGRRGEASEAHGGDLDAWMRQKDARPA